MDVDLSDPMAAQQEIKRASRMAQQSPQRVNRQEQQKAKANLAVANAEEGPEAAVKKQIAQLQQRIVMLQQKLIQMEKMRGGDGGGGVMQ